MNRRRVAATGLAVAALVGTAGPSWAFWTLTSDPASTAGAKADALVAAHAQAGRNGESGKNAMITIRLGAGIADRFTVYRGPDLVCQNKPANQTCEETGSNNSGDKTYTITQYTGTNWVSTVTTCVFKNNNAVADASSVNCSPLTNPAARSIASSENNPDLKSPSKAVPAPTPVPEAPDPTPTPRLTDPAPTADNSPAPSTEEPAATPAEQPTETPAPAEEKVEEPAERVSTEPKTESPTEAATEAATESTEG